MHELAVCRSLLAEVAGLAGRNGADAVISITVGIGPLSGVEPGLLRRAFSLVRCGTIAQGAALRFETPPIRVRCRTCAGVSTAAANRLLCAHCGDWRTELISGDELILMSVELECGTDGRNGEGAGAGARAPGAAAEA
ncbi:MAG: hydrogenase maturation nickel metallochaperone HypA [Rhodospirillales bacterium]|nr:hydrogenase maturation nickel metallochaperone HypA [Rhodospirillales bacterium]